MNIVVLGPQGCGKGTQSKRLAKQFSLAHISTGDLLREYVKNNGPRAEEVRRIMDEGRLIDDEFLEEITLQRLNEPDCQNGFVLDGTPRDIHQARIFDEAFSVEHVFLIEVSEEESLARVAKRMREEHREDDTPQALKKRLALYREQTIPVLEHYERKGLLRRINGEKSVEDVYADILAILEETA